MTIKITSDEILKKYNWERFCDIVSNSIDIQQDAYELTFEQAVKCGFIGLPKYYCVYQNYYDFQGDYVNEFIGYYKEEDNAKSKVREIKELKGDVRNDNYDAYYDNYDAYYHTIEPIFKDDINVNEISPKLKFRKK